VKSPRLRIAAALVVVTALSAAMALLPVRMVLRELLEWMDGLGFWAPVLLVIAYVVACLCFIPGLLLSVGAGFLFGVVEGAITVSVGSVLGATAAFLVGRTLGRGAIERMIAGHPKFAAIHRAVGVEGFKIVLLTRLSPAIPFNVLNYALGLTPVKLRDFVLASWIGMFPATLMYVYIGSTLADLAELGDKTHESAAARHALLALGLAATILLTVLVTRMARKALGEAVDEAASEPIAHAPADNRCTDALGRTSPD
jgi:uncharacterized membrane protein YdjX (TVP38/TMEM64 family)